MNIFGIGLPEMVVIFVLALLIFGPKKLPEIGRSLGKTLRSFQEASKEFESEIKKGVAEMEQDKAPKPSTPALQQSTQAEVLTESMNTASSNGVVPEELGAVSQTTASDSEKPAE